MLQEGRLYPSFFFMLDQPTEVSLCKDGLIYHTANDNDGKC